MPRLFLAIDLDEKAIQQLQSISLGVPGARWAQPDQLHLTLRFIGEIDDGVAEELADALSGIDADPFSLSIAGIGHFPTRGEPKIIWAGVDDNEALKSLRHKINRIVADIGLPAETRKWSPHITLARLHDTPSERVGRYIVEHNLLRCEPFNVEQFHLYSSQLLPKGAVYTKEYSYPLVDKRGMSFREKWQKGLV